SYRVRMPLLHVYHIQSLQTLPAIVISLEKIGCGRQESSIFGVQLLIRDEFLDPDRKSGISKKNVEADWTSVADGCLQALAEPGCGHRAHGLQCLPHDQ